MKCKCKAKPKPDVTWFRGTTAVKESSKIKIMIVDLEEDKYELSLEIKVSLIIAYESYKLCKNICNILTIYIYKRYKFTSIFYRILRVQTAAPTGAM